MRRRAAPWETDSTPGPSPGDDAPRWPTAPEPLVEDGDVVNAKRYCTACDSPSTLSYRCSECGADLTGKAGRGIDDENRMVRKTTQTQPDA